MTIYLEYFEILMFENFNENVIIGVISSIISTIIFIVLKFYWDSQIMPENVKDNVKMYLKHIQREQVSGKPIPDIIATLEELREYLRHYGRPIGMRKRFWLLDELTSLEQDIRRSVQVNQRVEFVSAQL